MYFLSSKVTKKKHIAKANAIALDYTATKKVYKGLILQQCIPSNRMVLIFSIL